MKEQIEKMKSMQTSGGYSRVGLNTGQPRGKEEKIVLPAQRIETLLRRLVWFVGVTMVVSVGLMIAIVVLLAGGYNTTIMMTDMNMDMKDMLKTTKEPMNLVGEYINELKSKFPQDQDVIAVRQGLEILANTNNILAQVSFLMQHVDKDTVHQLTESANRIAAQIDTTLQGVDQGTIERVKMLVAHLIELVGGITPDQTNKLMDGLANSALHFGKLEEEAENSHLMQQSAGLFQEFQSALHEFNGGKQLALGFVKSKE